MTGVDKRGQLSSGLLVAKSGDGPAARRSALKLASDADAMPDEVPEAPAEPAPTDSAILYSKGDASASTFRPSYWSYDRKADSEPLGGATVTPISAAVAAAKAGMELAYQAPVHPKKTPWYRRTLNIALLSLSTGALLASAVFFALLPQQSPVPTPAAAAIPSAAPAASAPSPAPIVVPLQPATVALVPSPPEPTADAPAAVPAPPAAASPAAIPPAPAPATTATAASSSDPSVSPVAAPDASTARRPAAAADLPAAVAPATETPAAAAPTQDAAQDVGPLLARGDELRATGDFVSARLFYERAAEQGSAPGARAVGETYDPLVLDEAHAMGVRGDAETAARWYREAIASGDAVSVVRLQRLLARKSAN